MDAGVSNEHRKAWRITADANKVIDVRTFPHLRRWPRCNMIPFFVAGHAEENLLVLSKRYVVCLQSYCR